MWHITSVCLHTAHFVQHTDITLKDVPNREYMLRLFIENMERELQRKDNYTWTPVQHQYVPYFSNTYTHQCMSVYRDVSPTTHIHAELQMKTGHSILAKYWEASKVISLQGLFNDYCNPGNHDLTVLGWSLSPTIPAYLLIEKDRAYCRWKIWWLSRVTIQ